jgi:hypothetical protein
MGKSTSVIAPKGQFLWMEQTDRECYISTLKNKIAEGYYYSESIISKIVEELAPVIADTVQRE